MKLSNWTLPEENLPKSIQKIHLHQHWFNTSRSDSSKVFLTLVLKVQTSGDKYKSFHESK